MENINRLSMERKRLLSILLAITIIGGGSLGTYLIFTGGQLFPPRYPIQIADSLVIAQTEFEGLQLRFENHIEGLDLDILPLPSTSSDLFKAEWNITCEAEISQKLLRVDFDTEMTDDVITISLNNFKAPVKSSTDLSVEYFTIYINPCLETYSFFSDSATTRLNLELYNMTFDSFIIHNQAQFSRLNITDCIFTQGLELISESGRINFESTRGQFLGDVLIVSDRRDILADIWNPIMGPDTLINISAFQSSAFINYMQHTRWNHTVNINLYGYLSAEGDLFIPNNLTNFIFNFQGEDGHMLSTKYVEMFTNRSLSHIETLSPDPSADTFILNATTPTGDVFVHHNTCFKPLRYCGTHPNFGLPVDHILVGDASFSKTDSQISGMTITDCEIRSYLPNVDFNITTVDASSPNFVQTHWNLTYQTGGGLGYSDIQVSVEFSIEEGILVMSIFCEFEIDEILPYFQPQTFDIRISADLTPTFEDLSPTIYVAYPF